jgi:hypothetical protein
MSMDVRKNKILQTVTKIRRSNTRVFMNAVVTKGTNRLKNNIFLSVRHTLMHRVTIFRNLKMRTLYQSSHSN